MTFGEKVFSIHFLAPAPIDAASVPLVTIARTAAAQTMYGRLPLGPRSAANFAAIAAAVTCPTSPHSEKKIAANETIAAFPAGVSSFLCSFATIGFRHTVYAT